MKAKKAKPIPKQQQTLLVGRDYLSLLIRQLDLEIHVTNMIFRKFINPKVSGHKAILIKYSIFYSNDFLGLVRQWKKCDRPLAEV